MEHFPILHLPLEESLVIVLLFSPYFHLLHSFKCCTPVHTKLKHKHDSTLLSSHPLSSLPILIFLSFTLRKFLVIFEKETHITLHSTPNGHWSWVATKLFCMRSFFSLAFHLSCDQYLLPLTMIIIFLHSHSWK